MKLSKIEITYFRCFESLRVDFQPDVNVIVGANGSGKSSILDAVAIALYELVAANGPGGQRQRKAQSTSLLHTDIYTSPPTVDGVSAPKQFVQVRASANDYYPIENFTGKTSTGQAAALEWSQHILFQPPARFSYSSSTTERLSSLNQYIQALWREIGKSPQALIPLPVVAYYRATRRMGGTPELGDIFKLDLSRDKAYTDALNAAANFTAMCQWFYLRENAELRARVNTQDGQDQEFVDLRATRQALKQTIEGLERLYFDGSPPRLMVDIREANGGVRTLELAQLSDGYRNLLALVLDFARRLAQANPTWSNPLEAPGILLIDEIELHLHPRWQQTVIPGLRAAFPNTQLIVSTHSPAVLTTVRREHIHLLGADHGFEHIPDDVGTYGAENSRILAEVFGADSRPRNIDTVEKLNKYLVLIENRQHDTESARDLRNELESALGRSDPDLRRADLRIRQIQVMGKQ
ncbi:AAA family ATPase [Noviherbaspirillum sp. ST9]|uniref:AAA family ATPase n=1 Tax=Noviherbaspirillum sp. ST9 TaxID=3401606 RepID=UPI003B58ABB5